MTRMIRRKNEVMPPQ